MTGRELEGSLTRNGHERAVRRIALQDKLATAEAIAEMSLVEVCDLVAQNYEMLCITHDENIILYKPEDKEKVDSVLKLILR